MSKRIRLLGIRPVFSYVLVRGLGDGIGRSYGYVLGIGNTVRSVVEGDIVHINFASYMRREYSVGDEMRESVGGSGSKVIIDYPIVEVGGEECLYIQERDIDFIVQDYEVESSSLILPDSKIIM